MAKKTSSEMLTRKDTLTTSLVADKDASVLTIPTPTIETGVALSTQLTDVAALTGNQKLVKKTEKVQQQVSEVRQGISLAQESIARIERWGKKRSEPKALTAGSRTIEDREQGISPSGLQFTLEAGGLPGDTFEVVSFNLTESYSQVFQLHVEALSRNPGVSGVLNGQAVLRVWQDGKPLREIRGMVSEFEAGDSGFHHTAYRLLITSDLWRLTLRNNSRIFQQKDIQTILSTVLSENSVAQYSFMLTDSHPEREFCVQYRETDFEFFNRLTAEEGIFYYVNAKGMLILTDDAATLSGRIQLSYNPNKNAQLQEKTVNRFTHSHKVRTSRAVLRDYTFKKPKWKAEFEVGGGYEHYDYPGRFKDARGKQYTGYRLDSLRRDVDIGWGETNSPQLYAGGLLQLTAHPNEEFNRVWQLTSVSYHGEQPQGGKQEAGDKATILLGTFEVIPRHQTWRPYQRTKPRVEGPQIAIVTGPPGEEIYTDNFGRVRLQFLWDREGKYDDHSSCWIRVAQPWAGKGWGMIAIPRVGQEVVVDFLDGDPDQPIVTGRTYHANMPLPAELPKHKTQMHLMSQTYKGGGYNGMVMEDKKGRQRLDFQAQKDMNTLVLNNRTTKVKGNHTETVKGEQKLSVQQTRLKNVVGNETVDIGAEQIVTVGKDYRLKVKNELFMKSDLESIIFETAGARLTLHKEGNIALEAKEVRILGEPVELNPGGSVLSESSGESESEGEGTESGPKGASSLIAGDNKAGKVAGKGKGTGCAGVPSMPSKIAQVAKQIPGIVAAVGGVIAAAGRSSGGSNNSETSSSSNEIDNQNIPKGEGVDADISTLTASLNGDIAENVEKTEKKKSNYTLKVITNENSWAEDGDQQIHALPFVGTHAGLILIDNNDSSKSILYDPNGSYQGNEPRGTGDYFIGEGIGFNSDDYMKYQYEDGKNVQVHTFNISDKEAKRITDNIEEGCGGGMSCSICTSQVLDGGDETFKDLGLHRRPYALGEQLRNIKKGSKNE